MQIYRCKDYTETSLKAEQQLFNIISNSSKISVGLPAGQTPLRLYELLVKDMNNAKLRDRFYGIQLDEYIGYGQEDPHSFYYFLNKNFIKPAQIDPQHILAFDGKATDPMVECKRFSKALTKMGTIDIMLLGFGWNGHVAFNEPGTTPEDTVRIITLQSNPLDIEPENNDLMLAMTIGMKEILGVKTIILLISGKNKQASVDRFLRGEAAHDLPASLLKNHADLHVYIDDSSITG
jgi:glucosamine-6-phosphate deaminase